MTIEASGPGPAVPGKAGSDNTVPPKPARPERRVIDSAELLQHGTELQIAHDGAVYTLRLTRQNKLILTK